MGEDSDDAGESPADAPVRGGVTPAEPDRWVRVSLGAVRRNIAGFVRLVDPARVMAVVKADAYGHGAVQVATAALAGGATWLGVAHIGEALPLRRAGIDAPILAWLHTPRSDFVAAVAAQVCLGISTPEELELAAQAARLVGRAAVVHLKVDTGLGRNGATALTWQRLVAQASARQEAGEVVVDGVFSHLSVAENPARDRDTDQQRDAFRRAVAAVRERGLTPSLVHLANTAAALRRPDLHFDMVRIGIGTYGLSPLGRDEPTAVPLTPALSLHTVLSGVKRLPAGHGVSYGGRFVTDEPTWIGLVPVGYGDGLPRAATGLHVTVRGRARPVLGVIAMDQLVVALGTDRESPDDRPRAGDEVVVISTDGVNTVDDWATAAGTINYEIVTRLTARAPRRYR